MMSALFLSALAAGLISSLFPQLPFDWIVSALCVAAVAAAFGSVGKFVRMVGSLFLLIGFLLLLSHGAKPMSYLLAFGGMLNILSLFALVPLVAIPIQLGRYAERVQEIIRRRVRRTGVLYGITSFLSYLFSSFMSVAALPMVYHTIRNSTEMYPIEHKDRFLSRAITHGFGMPLLWTPVTPMVGIVVEMTGVSWSAILPIVLPLSLLGLALDWLTGLWLSARRARRTGPAAQELAAASECGEPASGTGAKHPAHIIVVIVVFNLAVSALERFTNLGFLLLVTIFVVPFAFGWAMSIGKTREFVERSRKAVPEQVLKMKEQFFVFLSAGFMIAAFQTSGADHTISLWLNMCKDAIGPESFLVLIPLIPFAMAFLGIHPAVALTLAAESLKPETLGIPVEFVAAAMLTGAAASFLVGPYNATIGIMSGLTGRSTYRISNWNLPFTAGFLLLGMGMLFILQKGG